jgi:hypothetical protein
LLAIASMKMASEPVRVKERLKCKGCSFAVIYTEEMKLIDYRNEGILFVIKILVAYVYLI